MTHLYVRKKMTSTMNELLAISHDIRKLGWKKLPRNVERAAVIFSRGKSHRNLEGAKECLKFGKLAKYMLCEVFFIIDPTVDEFIDVMRHFVTETKEILLCFTASNTLNAKSSAAAPMIPFVGDNVDPELLFDMLNSKKPENKIFFIMDGINKPDDWDPKKNGSKRDGVYVCAPYAASADAIQFDSEQESFFATQLYKVVKAFPDSALSEIVGVLSEQIEPFGLKPFVASYPPNLVNEPRCFV